MSIEWYPGHIAKARRTIKEHLKDVDIVIEIIDARCPISSINFLYEEIKGKKHLIVANKVDLVESTDIDRIKVSINKKVPNKDDLQIIFLDSRNNDIKRIVDKKLDIICKDVIDTNLKKGIINTKIKAMVVGMPNVGKSTFINSYVKKKVNDVENKAGVTKSLKWTKISDKLLLLDTPGVTIPKFANDDAGLNLAFIGSINDAILDRQDLMYRFIDKIKIKYIELLKKRYKIEVDGNTDTIIIIDEIAKNNGCIKKGACIDYEKVSNMIIKDFRSGKIGKISLE